MNSNKNLLIQGSKTGIAKKMPKKLERSILDIRMNQSAAAINDDINITQNSIYLTPSKKLES